MQIVIDIDERYFEIIKASVESGNDYKPFVLIAHGTPLLECMEELKRKLLMEVDGGTDDKYLRYTDVCDRISDTIDTYIKAKSEEQE